MTPFTRREQYLGFNEKTLYGQRAAGLLNRANFAEFDLTALKNLYC